MPVSVRPFRPDDRAAVVALWRDCGLVVPWNSPEGDLDRALAGATSTVLVAADAGAVVGAVMCGDDGHRGWVYYLAATPARQGDGIGRALMDAAMAWLKARGVRKLELMVRDSNERVLGFYDRLGFRREPVAVLSHWLIDGDPTADAQAYERTAP